MRKDGSTGKSLTTAQAAAGFASPADEFIEGQLDLNELLVKHPAATFFMRANGGTAMAGGIRLNDILVVDRSLKAGHRAIVVAVINGELALRRMIVKDDDRFLRSDENKATEVQLKEGAEVEIWGVVSAIVRDLT